MPYLKPKDDLWAGGDEVLRDKLYVRSAKFMLKRSFITYKFNKSNKGNKCPDDFVSWRYPAAWSLEKTGKNGWMNIVINKTREIEEKETRTHFGRKKKR